MKEEDINIILPQEKAIDIHSPLAKMNVPYWRIMKVGDYIIDEIIKSNHSSPVISALDTPREYWNQVRIEFNKL
jgi:sporulation protein YlmC with PRC-barrel domain